MNLNTTDRTLDDILADMRAAHAGASDRLQPTAAPQDILNYYAEALAASQALSLHLWRQLDNNVTTYKAWMDAEANITTLMNEARSLQLLAHALIADIEEGL